MKLSDTQRRFVSTKCITKMYEISSVDETCYMALVANSYGGREAIIKFPEHTGVASS